MADAADIACIHLVKGISHTDVDLTYGCLDCGRPLSVVDRNSVAGRRELDAWGARANIPERRIASYARQEGLV